MRVMSTSRKRLQVTVFGILIFVVVNMAESRERGASFVNILSEPEQNSGDNCSFGINFNCDSNYVYRKINGECTNLDYPYRGKAETPCTRLLPAIYMDGISKIRPQCNGKNLDSPRVISNVFCTELPVTHPNYNDRMFTLSLMQWAQVIAHDVVGTSSKQGPACCTAQGTRLKTTTDNCIPIYVPTNDRFYSKFQKTCIDMPRSKSTADIGCPITPILPINFVTAYLDASLVYASKEEMSNQLRTFNNGLLKNQIINNQMFPANINEAKSVCRISKDQDLCIQAGDSRANAHPMLAIMQTILLRFHNMLAADLFKINPHWNDEKLFQESRRIVIAVVQFITYHEFVPNLLGKNYLTRINCCLVNKKDYNNVYDKTVNPQMLTEFISSAFRFLHSMIVNKVNLYNEERVIVSEWKFSDFYNAVSFLTDEDNFKKMVIGMAYQPPSTLDRHFSTSITDLLFQVNGVGTDMESLDIGKSREMANSPFVSYLEMLGNERVTSWEELAKYIPEKMIERLKTRYACVEDVELFVGGMLEIPAPDTNLGSVFQAIIGEQFCRLQIGDRFYYELGNQPHSFTLEQLEQIRKVTLAFLYCYTTTDLKFMQPDAFRQINANNSLKLCSEIMDGFTLNPWKE